MQRGAGRKYIQRTERSAVERCHWDTHGRCTQELTAAVKISMRSSKQDQSSFQPAAGLDSVGYQKWVEGMKMGGDVLGDVKGCKGGVESGYDLCMQVWRCQRITKEEKEEKEKKKGPGSRLRTWASLPGVGGIQVYNWMFITICNSRSRGSIFRYCAHTYMQTTFMHMK